MAQRTVLVCDFPACGNPGKSYTVGADDTTTIIDLCDDHSAPLRVLLQYGQPAKRGSRRRSTPRAPKVTGPSYYDSIPVVEDD